VYKTATYRSEQTKQANYPISTKDIPSEDGKYAVSVYVIDNAGNTTTLEKTVFVDKSSLEIKGIYLTIDEDNEVVIGEEKIMEKYVEETEYGYYFKEDVTVSVVAEDIVAQGEHTSGVESMVVYLKDSDGVYHAVLEAGTTTPLDDSGDVHQITPITTDREVSFTPPELFKAQIIAK